jgi:hypothetical protein
MLKETWKIEPAIDVFDDTRWIFQQKTNSDVMILVVAPTESEAWEKLGGLLGKEDKGKVETEVFEGVVSVYNRHGYTNADISLFVAKEPLNSLKKYDGQTVEVEIRIQP